MNNFSGIEDNTNALWNVTITQNMSVNTAPVVAALLVVIWTILSNSALVVCFVINRNKILPSFSTHIVGLSVSDMCVGYASLPLCIFATNDIELSYGVCTLVFFLFFASQCASLYHIFGICIHRCVLIHKSAIMGERRSDVKTPLFLVVSAWIFSIAVCSLPHLFYGEQDVEIHGCVIHELFKDNFKKVTLLLFVIYFVPQVLTTMLYIVACFRLRCIWRKVYPDHTGTLETTTGLAPHATVQSLNQMDIPSDRISIRKQRKVMGTIGVLLLVFNICTVPLILLLKMESDELETKRNLRFIASTLFTLNSALNPFVYALRTDWLKVALKKMFKDFFDTICLCKQ